MKREIKFRGKRKTDGEWLYGYYFVNRGLHFIVTDDLAPAGNTFEDYEVDPETVGQYTELKDRKGKEIYEGDIIVSQDYSHARHYVRYIDDEAMFVAMIIGSSLMEYCAIRQSWIDKYDKKIIGNIHDNPELLEL